MKTITINIPDDYEVQVVRNEAKFKKWDIIASVSKPTLISVYEKTDYLSQDKHEKVVYYSTIYSTGTKEFIRIDETDYGIGSEEDCRKAIYNEISEFIEALTKESVSNPKARKVLKEVFNKEVEPVIRTYQDLIDNKIEIEGYWTDGGEITYFKDIPEKNYGEDVAITKKITKSMLAMAMISQLMPYYGGAITDEEWANSLTYKYVICKVGKRLQSNYAVIHTYQFLAFHTKEQRDDFLTYNMQLVKDYLMLD